MSHVYTLTLTAIVRSRGIPACNVLYVTHGNDRRGRPSMQFGPRHAVRLPTCSSVPRHAPRLPACSSAPGMQFGSQHAARLPACSSVSGMQFGSWHAVRLPACSSSIDFSLPNIVTIESVVVRMGMRLEFLSSNVTLYNPCHPLVDTRRPDYFELTLHQFQPSTSTFHIFQHCTHDEVRHHTLHKLNILSLYTASKNATSFK